ncbi:tetratricopeptide repeat protein [Oxalobacteraceae bacterium A2-2]
MLKTLLALLCAAMLAAPAGAVVLGNPACQALLQEGRALAASGRFKEAMDKFMAAKNADPSASAPLAAVGHLLWMLSEDSANPNAAKARQQAELSIQMALKLDAEDPLAQEVQRLMSEEKPAPLHQPSREANAAAAEGEALFQAGKYAEALVRFQRAAELDPAFSTAYVYAGDCYFAQKQYAPAEALFRKATEVEPLNGQAWRFLSDALALQGRMEAAQQALLNGIAAQPSQRPSWDKLAYLRKAAGKPLQPLQLVRKVRLKQDGDSGKYSMVLDASLADKDQASTPDSALWIALGAIEANLRNQKDGPPLSPYQLELESWRKTMTVADELSVKPDFKLTDPGLLHMRELAKAGQLETAVLLLLYKESYRPELEAWKAANPNGVKKFIDTVALRP